MTSACTLFVGDLSIYCTKQDIEGIFSSFGLIKDIRIKRDEETGKNLSYGFVEFQEVSSAVNALQNLNGQVLCGRPMRMKWAANKPKDSGFNSQQNAPRAESNDTSSVHVTYNTLNPNVVVTEELLRNLFSSYGLVLDATVKKAIMNQDQSGRRGYGFVHFANTQDGVESAIKAATAMANVTIDNVCYRCGMSKSFEQRLSTMMNHYRTLSPLEAYSMNCYYYNKHQQQAMMFASATVNPAVPQLQQSQQPAYCVSPVSVSSPSFFSQQQGSMRQQHSSFQSLPAPRFQQQSPPLYAVTHQPVPQHMTQQVHPVQSQMTPSPVFQLHMSPQQQPLQPPIQSMHQQQTARVFPVMGQYHQLQQPQFQHPSYAQQQGMYQQVQPQAFQQPSYQQPPLFNRVQTAPHLRQQNGAFNGYGEHSGGRLYQPKQQRVLAPAAQRPQQHQLMNSMANLTLKEGKSQQQEESLTEVPVLKKEVKEVVVVSPALPAAAPKKIAPEVYVPKSPSSTTVPLNPKDLSSPHMQILTLQNELDKLRASVLPAAQVTHSTVDIIMDAEEFVHAVDLADY